MASRPSRASRASAPKYDDGQSNDGSEFEKESSYDPGVPRCYGAFTPSTRVVSRRGGRGWFLFRFWGRFGPRRDRDAPRRSESEEEEEEVIVESDDEPQKKRKSSSKKPAPKKARTEYTIEEHEKGTIKRPTENTITSTGAFNDEFAFALDTICSVLCEKTNR